MLSNQSMEPTALKHRCHNLMRLAAANHALVVRHSRGKWIYYNHAPPGTGYMHLLYALYTRGAASEHQREVAGENRFIKGDFPTDFRDASITVRLKGELEAKGTQLVLLCQGLQEGICSGWMLTGREFWETSMSTSFWCSTQSTLRPWARWPATPITCARRRTIRSGALDCLKAMCCWTKWG